MYDGMDFRERKKVMTKTKITQIARELFIKKGFDNVTVVEIAKKSGISVKTLFSYFNSKEDIVFGEESKFKKEVLLNIDNWDGESSFIDLSKNLMYKVSRFDSDYIVLRDEFEEIIKRDSNRKITSLLLLLWHGYEMEVAEHLKVKVNLDESDPHICMMANVFMLPFRMSIVFRTKNKARLDLTKQEDKDWIEEIFKYMEKTIS